MTTPPVPFKKSHLEYPQLIDYMRAQGLKIDDETLALRVLEAIGYHRLGGYRYPFRQLLDESAQRPDWHQWRSDRYVEGSTFEDVVALERFDNSMRTLLMDGLVTFEIGLRNAVAHVVGRTTILGYMEAPFLDQVVCAEIVNVDGEPMTKLDSWRASIQESVERAKRNSNDAVIHHLEKYGAPVPIWTAMELLSFGKLPFFLDMLTQGALNEIGAVFGLKQGQKVKAWAFAYADLRNLSAHGARVWNRTMKRNLKVVSSAVDDRLFHIAADKVAPAYLRPGKLYQVAAALAYNLKSFDATSSWPRQFADLIDNFPTLSIDLDPLASVGAPANWRAEGLWS